MSDMQELISEGQQFVAHTYAQVPVVFKSGKGCWLYDVDGKAYLDFVGGIAVNILGYGNEGLMSALKKVLEGGVLHCSNLYWNEPEITAAKKLVALSGMDNVFFCNSGAEANEASLKLARKYGALHGGKYKIISMQHSFHGRTYGAITATGQEKYHKNFQPLLSGIEYAIFNDLDSVKALVDEKTCAVLVEPIQGEGGVIPATVEFLEGLRKLCDEKGLLLLFDEVQCGMGRSGYPFCFQGYGVQPDVVACAKAVAGGVPCGVMLSQGKASTVFEPGDHASTFGGNFLAATGASYIADILADPAFCASVRAKGSYLKQQLEKFVEKYPALCVSVRGRGLMLGLQLAIPPRKVVDAAFEKQLLVLSAGSDVLRFVPPLIVSKEDIDRCIAILDEAFASLA
ncbi:MAG: aspartate aminotransferase family protein [Spirochaetia bacterium]|jgi:predicted acetylornithine/succinylornithine family transaminase|nr:aspartate aminotransferase family protein [Spirochaetia bacterium]